MWMCGLVAIFAGVCVFLYVIIVDRFDEIKTIAAVRRRRIRWIDREIKKKRFERVEKRRRGFFATEDCER